MKGNDTMTNLDVLNEMKVGEFVEKFCHLSERFRGVEPNRRPYYNLCRLMFCRKCPFYGCGNCIDHLIDWCNEDIDEDESELSDEAKKTSYNDLISAYYRCHKLHIGCETVGKCPLYDLPDMNCEEIFDYHFSAPDCPFDPRTLK